MTIEKDTFKQDEFYFFAVDECTDSATWASVEEYYTGYFDADLMYFGIFKATEGTINALIGLDIENDVDKIQELVELSYSSLSLKERKFADALLEKAKKEFRAYYWG